MHIGVIGASGNVGRRVLAEALQRGHHVTAFTRDVARAPVTQERVTWKEADVLSASTLTPVLVGLDVLVSLYQPGNASKDFNDTVARSIADPGTHVTAARALLKAMEPYPALRLIVVGGAGSLESRPGVTLADSPAELHAILEAIGLPKEYAAAVRGARDGLNVYRTSNRLWTYLSPAADIHPGERTGRFRLGGDQPVVDVEGRSRISFEDFAVAVLDEAELPRHVQRRFTIGY